ncbi:hypothetical protein AB2762_00755 [Acinetobacter indicus]
MVALKLGKTESNILLYWYQNKLHHYRCVFNGTKKKKLEQLSRAISQSIIEVTSSKNNRNI